MKKYSLDSLLASLLLAAAWFSSPAEISAQRASVVADRTANYAIGEGAEFAAFDGNYVWVANQFSNTVTKLAAANGSIAATYNVPGNPLGIAFDGRNVWVSRFASNDVVSLDRETGAIGTRVKTDRGPGFLLYNGKDLWVANRTASTVQRISPLTGTVDGTYNVGKRPAMMAYDGTSIWVANGQSKSVSRINTADRTTTEFKLAGGAGAFGVVFDGSNIWVSNFFGGTIEKLSLAGESLKVHRVGDGLAGMYYSNQHMWVVANGDSMIYRVRLSDGTIVNRYQVSASPYGILFDGQRFWTQASGARQVSAVTPATADEIGHQ